MFPDALEKYQNRLVETRARLIDQFQRQAGAVREDISGEGDLSHVPTHLADRDSEGVQKEIALEESEGQLLNQVNLALQRIEDGSYGRCQKCGREIQPARLEALKLR
jgi:RNA polymerase-binding transcription factor DksA